MAVKELACVEMSIDRDTAFVKQIPKGVVMVGVCDNTALVGEGVGTAEAVVKEIYGEKFNRVDMVSHVYSAIAADYRGKTPILLVSTSQIRALITVVSPILCALLMERNRKIQLCTHRVTQDHNLFL